MPTVLIISDSNTHAQLLIHALQSADFTVLRASSVQDAVLMMSGLQLEAVVADVYLEQDNVFDLLRYSKTHDGKPPVVCIGMSNSSLSKTISDTVRMSCEILGAAAFISPVSGNDADISAHLCAYLRRLKGIKKDSPIDVKERDYGRVG